MRAHTLAGILCAAFVCVLGAYGGAFDPPPTPPNGGARKTDPEKPAPAVVKLEIIRLAPAGAPNTWAPAVATEDKAKIAAVLTHFPELGEVKKFELGIGGPPDCYMLLHRSAGDPIRINIYCRDSLSVWSWSQKAASNGAWAIREPEQLMKRLDELCPGPKPVEKSNPPAKASPGGAAQIPEKVKRAFRDRTIDILNAATKVEVLRLAPKPGPRATPTTVGSEQRQWTIDETGADMDGRFATKVRTFLLDGSICTIGWEPELERADFAFRLWKEKESVTVIVDFGSGSFTVVTRDGTGKLLRAAGGSFTENGDREYDETGALFARMKALAVEAFPRDKKIKAARRPKAPEEKDLLNPDK
jgi:hypothetical protein